MGHCSADYVHAVVEAMKLAMADRDAHYGDPLFVDVPMNALLSDEYTQLRQPLIDMGQAALDARPGDPLGMSALQKEACSQPGVGGTTTCVVADRWGMVVSATPSANVYHAGGTGSTGVSYGNRLRSLNTTPGHPNCIAPGKRPRITLTPTLVLKDGAPVLAISVAGGDLQDQAALNLLLDFVEFGMQPADAVVAPRFATDHHEDSFDPNPGTRADVHPGWLFGYQLSGRFRGPGRTSAARPPSRGSQRSHRHPGHAVGRRGHVLRGRRSGCGPPCGRARRELARRNCGCGVLKPYCPRLIPIKLPLKLAFDDVADCGPYISRRARSPRCG